MSAPRSTEVRAPAGVPSPSGTTRDASDGRIALRLRNRQRVIDAMIDLVTSGVAEPSMASIIEQAGVSERSVFRYFNDVTDLVLTSMWTVLERIEPARAIANLGEGPLDDRIAAWVGSRIAITRQTVPFAALVARFRSTPEFQTTVLGALERVRSQIADQFAPELSQRTPDERDQVIDLLMTLSGLEGVDVLVRQLGLDEVQVEQRLTLLVRALLDESF